MDIRLCLCKSSPWGSKIQLIQNTKTNFSESTWLTQSVHPFTCSYTSWHIVTCVSITSTGFITLLSKISLGTLWSTGTSNTSYNKTSVKITKDFGFLYVKHYIKYFIILNEFIYMIYLYKRHTYRCIFS